MATTIQKWGNSLGLRIPRELAEDVGIAEGREVTIEKRNNTLVIVPTQKKQYSLDELVRKITPKNRHKIIDFGKPRGKEVW